MREKNGCKHFGIFDEPIYCKFRIAKQVQLTGGLICAVINGKEHALCELTMNNNNKQYKLFGILFFPVDVD